MKVVIFDEGFIPGLGRGPFRTPIEISEDKFFLYKQMGLKVINAEKTVPIAETGIRNRTIKNKIESEEIENIKTAPVEENIISTTNDIIKEVDETVDETEETVTEEKSSTEDEAASLEDLTKKELMSMLDEKEIKYQTTMLKSELIELVNEAYNG